MTPLPGRRHARGRRPRPRIPDAALPPRLACNSCGKPLKGLKLYYRVKAQITCEPNELSFTEGDLEKDHAAEVERISREAEGRDPKELEEEVFVLLDYYLCVGCKERFVKEAGKALPG
ncbi:MAG: hypothetical protein HY748_09145 [Elusimicrobia bacterium]|nr:hypothetical protein [Elusimicrobiota bacterium]